MKVLGIIAEYNPFHNGHIYHIKEAKKKSNADYIILIMSGPFTQSGNISTQDKFSKATLAINNGVDLVIELPVIYAVSSANYFAKAAISILDMLGVVDVICFGSECSNILTLKDISKKLNINEENIWNDIKLQEKNISFATSREMALKNILSQSETLILKNSNDILGIEYIKSLNNLNSKIEPICIKRNKKYKSATDIRSLLENNEYKNLNSFIPKDSYEVLKNKVIFNNSMLKLLKYTILNKGTNMAYIKDVCEGLENKIIASIIEAKSYNDLILSIKSKRYEMSKIKRILINTMLDIDKNKFEYAIKNKIFYAHILKINKNSTKLLSKICKESKIPIITSLSKNKLSKLNKDVLEYLYLDIKAQNIYSIISNENLNKDYTNKI